MDVVLDTMLRPSTTARATAPPAGGAAATARAQTTAMTGDDTRAEISRILASSVASGSLSTENRTYLAQLVSQRTGLPQHSIPSRSGDQPIGGFGFCVAIVFGGFGRSIG